MTDWFGIIFHIALGTFMILIGFKIYVPKFKSDEAKARLYKWSTFYQIGGILMLGSGCYKLFHAL